MDKFLGILTHLLTLLSLREYSVHSSILPPFVSRSITNLTIIPLLHQRTRASCRDLPGYVLLTMYLVIPKIMDITTNHSIHRMMLLANENLSGLINIDKNFSKSRIFANYFVDSERSEECIDFTMIITSRNNAPISNYGGGFRCKSEYPWCIIEFEFIRNMSKLRKFANCHFLYSNG
ncbi:hypothetical protein AGLY_008248 [Aphis glycines]|uniref:Uncharacterized protein n=1 Tax=Aphis glycines TaxID=307491 RepID=A0A6G0TNJ5_APHGL|nr:hypothetical protein AGLY_008248 [Aphis glycines]